MNKKGFTIIELLASITIIAIISTVGVVSYNSLMNQSATKVYEEYQDTLYSAASNYLLKNVNKPSVTLTFPLNLTIDDLNVETIKNPKSPSETCKEHSYVMITEDTSCDILAFSYEVCLKCGADFDNCKTYFNKSCS